MSISSLIKPTFPGVIPVKVTYEGWITFIEQKKKKEFVMMMTFLDAFN